MLFFSHPIIVPYHFTYALTNESQYISVQPIQILAGSLHVSAVFLGWGPGIGFSFRSIAC